MPPGLAAMMSGMMRPPGAPGAGAQPGGPQRPPVDIGALLGSLGGPPGAGG